MAKKPYPFVTKDGSLGAFKSVGTDSFANFSYGDQITGSEYPLTASVKIDYLYEGYGSSTRNALKNTLDYYTYQSKHYAFSSSLGNKAQQQLKLISIPSIFYGSSIRKGSVNCKWYITGTLVGELRDEKRNGELIQVGPSGSNGSGSVAGVVLYNEGFIVLTGSWELHSTRELYTIDNSLDTGSWVHFMTTGTNGLNTAPSSSFSLDFEGVNYIPTITMLAHADKGEFNHSNNPTYIKYGERLSASNITSTDYIEGNEIEIKNIVHSKYEDVEPKFEKITYISKIGIYDEERNLIGIAKLATPVRKKTTDNYTFKIKLDL